MTVGVTLGAEEENTGIFIQTELLFDMSQFGIGHDLGSAAEAGGAALAGDDPVILSGGIAQNAHALGGHIVGAGDKMIGVVTEHFPTDGAGLTAGQPRHDRIHIAADRMQLTVTKITQVRIQEAFSIAVKITTMVTMEEIHWGMDWETICRRVSMSLV